MSESKKRPESVEKEIEDTGTAHKRIRGVIPFLITLACSLTLCFAFGQLGSAGESTLILSLPADWSQSGITVPSGWFILLWLMLFTLSLLAVLLYPRGITFSRSVVIIGLLALTARVLMLPMQPSDDVNRYLWEGRILAAGFSPYSHAARPEGATSSAESEVDRFRDAHDPHWRGVNHPHMTAIYPPMMLLLMACIASISYSVTAVKGAALLLDMAVLVVLFALSRERLDPRWTLLYVLSPVVLVAFAGEGHNDVVQIFCVTLAILLARHKRWSWMWVVLGLAVQAKVIALLAWPFFLNRENWRALWLGLLIVIAPVLVFYLVDGTAIFESFLAFGFEMSFNGPVQSALRYLMGSSRLATLLCHMTFLVVYGYGLLLLHPQRDRTGTSEPIAGLIFVFGTFLLFSPTVHAWYVTWLLPLLVLRPVPSWLVLSATLSLTFVTYGYEVLIGVWAFPDWYLWLVWTAPLLLLLREVILGFRRRAARAQGLCPDGTTDTVTVIIPTKGEGNRIKACIDALKDDPVLVQIIVVDSGSTDLTLSRALEAGAEVMHHDAPFDQGGGRGGQVARGLTRAKGDVIAIIHADTQIQPRALSAVIAHLRREPDVVGGAVGSVFAGAGLVLRFVEAANDLRAAFLGISFGDQVQFFRRFIAEKEQFPALPLMEDVELSLRLGYLGRRSYLWGQSRVSPRRWQTGRSTRRVLLVLRLTGEYLLRRLFGPVDTVAMYRKYYSG